MGIKEAKLALREYNRIVLKRGLKEIGIKFSNKESTYTLENKYWRWRSGYNGDLNPEVWTLTTIKGENLKWVLS